MLREVVIGLNESIPKVFRNEKTDKWYIPSSVAKFAHSHGLDIIGIGETQRNVKAGRDAIFVFTNLFKNERGKDKEFRLSNKNKSERLVRYLTERTVVSGEAPLCILNAEKGYMRFMENIDEDPDLEDAQWSKPEFFDHLRTTY